MTELRHKILIDFVYTTLLNIFNSKFNSLLLTNYEYVIIFFFHLCHMGQDLLLFVLNDRHYELFRSFLSHVNVVFGLFLSFQNHSKYDMLKSLYFRSFDL